MDKVLVEREFVESLVKKNSELQNLLNDRIQQQGRLEDIEAAISAEDLRDLHIAAARGDLFAEAILNDFQKANRLQA